MLDNYVDERDYKLIEQDKYAFFVLGRVMGGDCELLLTDHEKLILCFTCDPYPVWIWTPDDASEADMERAYRLASEHSFLDGAHHLNLKYDLARFFIQRAASDGKTLSISLHLYAYDCPKPVEPTVAADGDLHLCTGDDLEELVEFLDWFHEETGVDQTDRESYRAHAETYIHAGTMYFWKDAQGNSVACCKYAPSGTMAAINLVFTHPAFRRKHYAENLVYQVTKLALDAGYLPMLYTDAEYIASNACYEKIGYIPQGKLCTIG